MKSLAIISSQAFSLINFRGQLIADLVAKGVKVFALAPDYTDDLRLNIRALGAVPVDFHLIRTGMSPWRDLWDMLALAVLLRQLSPDAALTYFIKPVIYGTLAAWMARVSHRVAMIEGLGYVFTSSGQSLSWPRRVLRGTVSVMYRVALSRARRVVFLNRDDILEFTKSGLVNPDKVEHIEGIGVDLDYWGVANAVVSPVTFVLAARLLREKGVVEFAQAAARVKALHPTARFILLGALDPNPGSLDIDEIKSWVSSGTIEWPGHVDPMPWIAQASVYVLPSYREGLPRSTLEAMAMGRAIITTDVPGCRETVVDGVNGFMVPKCDVLALTDAMLKFINQPEQVVTMGQESRRMVEARFDVKKINPQLLRILDPGSSPIRQL